MDTWITRYVFEETKSIRDYSSNIYYAWWVVERLKDLGYKVMVLTTGDIIGDLWQFSVADFYRQITFYDDKGGYANAETPSLAICRAALLARLEEKIERLEEELEMGKFYIMAGRLCVSNLNSGSWLDVLDKWYFIQKYANEIFDAGGSTTCAFCLAYNGDDCGDYCRGCPIYNYTGRLFCHGTPHYIVCNLIEAAYSDATLRQKRDVAIQDEINFLKNVLEAQSQIEEE